MAIYDMTVSVQRTMVAVCKVVTSTADKQRGEVYVAIPSELLIVLTSKTSHIYHLEEQPDLSVRLRYIVTSALDVHERLQHSDNLQAELAALPGYPSDAATFAANSRLQQITNELQDATPSTIAGVVPVELYLKPYVTYALILVNILMFVVSYGVAGYQWGATNQLLVFKSGEYYRLWTAMFLHANLAHLFFNMLALFFMGRVLEGRVGHLRFAELYLLAGLAGSLTSVILNTPNISSVGASGAVFGVFGALIVHDVIYRKSLGSPLQGLGRYTLRSMTANLLYSLFGVGAGIDHWAHVGGFLGGMVAAGMMGLTMTYVFDAENKLVVLIHERQVRFIQLLAGAIVTAVVLMVVTPTLMLISPQTVTVDNVSISFPHGWRVVTEFDEPEFAQLCILPVRCQVLTAPMDGSQIGLLVRKTQNLTYVLASLEDFANGFEQGFAEQHPDARLQQREETLIGGYPTITLDYMVDDYRYQFYFFKPVSTVVEFVQIDGNSAEIEAHRTQLQSIVNSIQFGTDGTDGD